MTYPKYSFGERVADGSMHAVGVLGAVTGTIILLIWASGSVPTSQLWALAIYGATLIATFVASAAYHMTPWEALRPALRQIDHAAIYLKIAGTYTPLVVLVGTGFAYSVLAVVWILASIGMSLRLILWRTPGRFGPVLYLVMGWLSVLLVWSLWPLIPGSAMALIVIGGLLYTAGVPFYVATDMKYANAIWHAFVVAGSACFFAAIALTL